MGLDWNPLVRPKEGHEEEFERLLAQDLDTLEDPERTRHIERIRSISDAPFETVGAPRVGHDPSANEWVLELLRKRGREAEYESVIDQMTGYYVLDLLPDSPGFPVYCSSGYEGVDRCTFRAKFLDYVEELIGTDLHNQAWLRMSAAELLSYGEALLQIAESHAENLGLGELKSQRMPPEPFDPEKMEGRLHSREVAGASQCEPLSGEAPQAARQRGQERGRSPVAATVARLHLRR